MGELTNLTDRLAHLRDRKQGSPILPGDLEPEQKLKETAARRDRIRERRFPTDYFVVFVYALLGVAVLTQFVLIGWLDIL
jgi:hypothetical protein